MGRRGAFSFAGPTALGASLVAATIFHAEGTRGFSPFLNLEALFLVLGGTLCCLSVAYPAGTVFRAVVRASRGLPAGDEEEARLWGEILRHGADSAMGMGGAATLLGMILMLGSIDDVSAVPRRMALALVAMFYGLMLSEAFFVPLARRVRGPDLSLRLPSPGGGARRMIVGLGSSGSATLSFFVVLYALSASLGHASPPPLAVTMAERTVRYDLPLISIECGARSLSRSDADASGEKLHWATASNLNSLPYVRTFAIGEEFMLEMAENRGFRCFVRRPTG